MSTPCNPLQKIWTTPLRDALKWEIIGGPHHGHMATVTLAESLFDWSYWKSPIIKRECHSVKSKHPHTRANYRFQVRQFNVHWCISTEVLSVSALPSVIHSQEENFPATLMKAFTPNDLESKEVAEGLAEWAGFGAQRGPWVSVTSWQPPCQHGCESFRWQLRQKLITVQLRPGPWIYSRLKWINDMMPHLLYTQDGNGISYCGVNGWAYEPWHTSYTYLPLPVYSLYLHQCL